MSKESWEDAGMTVSEFNKLSTLIKVAFEDTLHDDLATALELVEQVSFREDIEYVEE